MAEERYRHIFLDRPTRTESFTSHQAGGGKPKVIEKNPREHAQYLRGRLDEAWRGAERRRAVAHTSATGQTIEFIGEPGKDLVFQSLEVRKSGIRLMSVRTENEEVPEQTRTIATVFVPNEQRALFLQRLAKYESQAGKIKHNDLMNSVADIRTAVLESFWQDDPALIPRTDPAPVEVWLNSDKDEVIERFRTVAQQEGLRIGEGVLKFPERAIVLVHANRQHLDRIIQESDDVAELRAARALASYFIQQSNREQAAEARALHARTRFSDSHGVRICVLDTGVNNGHVLLQPVLDDADRHAVDPAWGVDDVDGHGTLTAGAAAYGDILAALGHGGPIQVEHRLESAKILRSELQGNPRELWGHFTIQGLSRAEIQAPDRKRIACLTVTSTETRDRGRPSAWSGAVDAVSSGYEDDVKRLFVLSAGNVRDPQSWLNYPTDNFTNEVHDPGQAWNALTVGGYTQKTHLPDPTMRNYTAVAPHGGLSPHSTTSRTWPIGQARRLWPVKPEIMLESGNVARGPNNSIQASEHLSLLSTSHEPHRAHFDPFSGTSAAAAQAAWMCARIQTLYPDAWPETVRGLMVHSAEWTDAMRNQFLPATHTKADREMMLRTCGYGVPDLDRALYCAANSLTLISQAEIQPFDKDGSTYRSKEMHLYRLPWPTDALAALEETRVSMRVTLSYFIEPSPSQVGWKDRYRYASHGLRFEVNGPGDSEEEFVQFVNREACENGDRPDIEGAREFWRFGGVRKLGSIHSDVWEGTARQLAASNLIAIFPAVGWWRERQHLDRWSKKTRYSLIVSITTPTTDVDIYTPVATQVGIRVPIPIPATPRRRRSR